MILLAIVVTMGVGAPEGVGLIVVTLGEAAIITAASLAVDFALDKPISLSGAAFEFGQNAVLGGALKILNAGLFAIALRYPGETLKRLAIIFGGNFVATTLSALLVQTIQTGEWPEHIGLFLAGCFVLNAVAGALTGPKVINALNTADRLQAEILAVGNRLVAQHSAWLREQDVIATYGMLSKPQHTAFKERGVQIFGDLKQWCDVMKKLPDAVLKNMGITREALDDFAKAAENAAIQINAHEYDLQPGVKRLPAPADVVPEGGLVPTSGTTIEYNPNLAGSEPAALVRRFRHAGYFVEENAGVLRLLLPGETNPRYLLLPVRAALPAPALRRLVGSPNSNAARGLRALQAQNAVPPLEAMLTRIAATDSGAVMQILEGMGRHINWRYIDDSAVLAIKGIAHFLEIGGSMQTLGVAMGLGSDDYGSTVVLAGLGRFNELVASDLIGLDVIVRIRGSTQVGTDAIAGIVANSDQPGFVLTGIGKIDPATDSGLSELIRQLASTSAAHRDAARESLTAALEVVASNPGARLRFEVASLRRAAGAVAVEWHLPSGRTFQAFSPAQLDQIVATTPDIRVIRDLARNMVPGSSGSLFERWANHYVFRRPVGAAAPRLVVRQVDNDHIRLLLTERRSDAYLFDDGSWWDAKAHQSASEIDQDQLTDNEAMQRAGYVYTEDGQRHEVKSINYLFVEEASARANAGAAFGDSDVQVWYIDDNSGLTLLH